MRFAQKALLTFLCVSFAVGPIRAQQTPTIVDSRTIDQALAEANESTRAKRQTIRTALQQPEVQRVAERLGVDLPRAQAAVATLDGGNLDRIAAQAQLVNEEIAGGQTVRLNLLWIIILLLVIILIVVAV
jgi:hypothetical protein